jgi:outer membrane protein OmpA-like peptidoglycan-associated protein
MNRLGISLCICIFAIGCGGSNPAISDSAVSPARENSDGNVSTAPGGVDEFGTRTGDASGGGVSGSKLTPTETEAVLKLIVQSEGVGPMAKVVVRAVTLDGKKFYTPETDSMGYTEILVPRGAQLTLTYLSLFADDIQKQTVIPDKPHVTMKLTLTWIPPKPRPVETPDPGVLIAQSPSAEPSLILDGVVFDTGKSTLRPESYEHIESVLEYLTYKPSAIIELSGHTDNVGNPKKNLNLSEDRANAVRDYLISKGIDGSRIIAVGYGEQRPIASNNTEEGRQLNRRTEAKDIAEP